MKERVKDACDTRDKARVAYGEALKALLGVTTSGVAEGATSNADPAPSSIDNRIKEMRALLDKTCKEYADLMTSLGLDSDMARERRFPISDNNHCANAQQKIDTAIASVDASTSNDNKHSTLLVEHTQHRALAFASTRASMRYAPLVARWNQSNTHYAHAPSLPSWTQWRSPHT